MDFKIWIFLKKARHISYFSQALGVTIMSVVGDMSVTALTIHGHFIPLAKLF